MQGTLYTLFIHLFFFFFNRILKETHLNVTDLILRKVNFCLMALYDYFLIITILLHCISLLQLPQDYEE